MPGDNYPAVSVPVSPADRDLLMSRSLLITEYSSVNPLSLVERCVVIVTPEVYRQMDALGVENLGRRLE